MRHLSNNHEAHKRVLKKVSEVNSENPSTANEGDRPVNILVFEGGGLRGFAHAGMVEGLVEVNEGEDVLQFFDLACGTSVGGIAALEMSRTGKCTTWLQDTKKVMTLILQKSLRKKNWLNLLLRGSLTNDKNSVANILRDHCGDAPLHNPNGLKAFALCSVRGSAMDENGASEIEPFVLRTYDLSANAEAESTFPGTNELFLWEAMAATSAAPILSERIDLEINGVKKRFADGCIVANNPTAIAIIEAQRMWPGRPIGVIMSLCLTNSEKDLVNQAVDMIKQSHPEIQFCRLEPFINTDGFMQSGDARLRQVQESARNYIHKSNEVRRVVDKLRSSGPRDWSKVASSIEKQESDRFGFGKSTFPRSFLARSSRHLFPAPATDEDGPRQVSCFGGLSGRSLDWNSSRKTTVREESSMTDTSWWESSTTETTWLERKRLEI